MKLVGKFDYINDIIAEIKSEAEDLYSCDDGSALATLEKMMADLDRAKKECDLLKMVVDYQSHK